MHVIHTHTFNLFFWQGIPLSVPSLSTNRLPSQFFEETFRRLAEAYEVLAANLTEEDVAG